MTNNNVTFPAAINVMYNRSSNCYQYRVIIYNAKFSKLLFGKKEKARLIKKDNKFYLVKDNLGNLLNPSPEHQTTFMSIRSMLNDMNEDLPLGNTKKSTTIKTKVNLDPSEWGLTTLDVFLESKEERDLAEKLMGLDYEVETITYNDKNKFESACADLILYYKNKKIPIEITITAPSESYALSGVNSPHGHQWTKVSGRITPLIVYSTEKNLKSFMIINQKWESYPHVRYIIDKLKNLNCHVLLSDFSDTWSTQTANEINRLLHKEE
jgi:hypothetical protein